MDNIIVQNNNNKQSCPECKVLFNKRELKPNIEILNSMENYKEIKRNLCNEYISNNDDVNIEMKEEFYEN